MRDGPRVALLLAGLALALACDGHTALDVEACARNCTVLATACPGFDGAACLAACDAGDGERIGCIEDRVQAGQGECPDFVACFPAAADVPGADVPAGDVPAADVPDGG